MRMAIDLLVQTKCSMHDRQGLNTKVVQLSWRIL